MICDPRLFGLVTALACACATGATATGTDPLFANSVASNDLQFISPDDPGACWTMTQVAGGRTEMYDPRRDTLFVEDALRFEIAFDGQTIAVNLHPGVANPALRAGQAAAALARLPVRMRSSLRHVNILDGDGSAWSEDAGRFFTLYDGLMTRRLADHDLDETVFHETAHVALDPVLSRDPDWRSNQAADPGFVTRYAADNPDTEDIAESALFVWTLTHHPGRLPDQVVSALHRIMPNRIDYLGNILAGDVPPDCPG